MNLFNMKQNSDNDDIHETLVDLSSFQFVKIFLIYYNANKN